MRPFKSIVSLRITDLAVKFMNCASRAVHTTCVVSFNFIFQLFFLDSFPTRRQLCFSQSGLCFFYSVSLGDVRLVNNWQPGSRSEYKLLKENLCLVWESKYHGGMVRNSHSIISFMWTTGNTKCTMAKSCNRLALEKLLPHHQFLLFLYS